MNILYFQLLWYYNNFLSSRCDQRHRNLSMQILSKKKKPFINKIVGNKLIVFDSYTCEWVFWVELYIKWVEQKYYGTKILWDVHKKQGYNCKLTKAHALSCTRSLLIIPNMGGLQIHTKAHSIPPSHLPVPYLSILKKLKNAPFLIFLPIPSIPLYKKTREQSVRDRQPFKGPSRQTLLFLSWRGESLSGENFYYFEQEI